MQVNCNTRARNTVDSSGSGVCRFGLSGHRDLDRMDRPLSKIKNVLSIVLYPHVAKNTGIYFHCEIIWMKKMKISIKNIITVGISLCSL